MCEVVRYCPNLDSAVLAGLHLLTDKTIFYMASSIATTLKYLYISGCSKMSSPAVTYLKVCNSFLLFISENTVKALLSPLGGRYLILDTLEGGLLEREAYSKNQITRL